KHSDAAPYARVRGERIAVPARPIDSRSLLSYAAALLGAGGTMNREAALLGTPVFSLYAGRLAALDQRLVDEGRLHLVRMRVDRLEDKLLELGAGRRQVTPNPSRHVLDRFLE